MRLLVLQAVTPSPQPKIAEPAHMKKWKGIGSQ